MLPEMSGSRGRNKREPSDLSPDKHKVYPSGDKSLGSHAHSASRLSEHQLANRSMTSLWTVVFITLFHAAFCRAADDPRPAPIAHWSFDGDTRDSGASGWNGKAMGKVAFVDSPIGGQGQLLSLDGVDAYVQVDNPAAGKFDAGDFSISLWMLPLELRWAGLIQRGDSTPGWSLFLSPDGAVHFVGKAGNAPSIVVDTPPNTIETGTWYHVVVSVDRSKPSEGARLYINGRASAAGRAPPPAIDASTPLLIGKGDGKAFFNGLMDDVQIYNAALGPEEVARLTDAGLAWRRPKPWAMQPFAKQFALNDTDVIVSTGGENALAAGQSAFLETLLVSDASPKRLYFRDMAWEGDTVFGQWRILNFGPWPYQLRRVGATVVVAQFGQMEALRGRAGLAEFVGAYDRLLNEWSAATRRIVLVSPIPFEKAAAPFPDLSARNGDVEAYVAAIGKIASEHGFLFVDLFHPLAKHADSAHLLTRDGIHLLPYGQWIVARETARQLGIEAADVEVNAVPAFAVPELETLRAAIRRKNELWLSYWRPTNWAFLNGDRVSQPSSRDHQDPRIRWFPLEVQESWAIISHEETAISKLALLAASRTSHRSESK